MANLPAETPVFLTRADVATLLRIGPRQVDRLATAGDLAKVKLAARRTGFHRDGVEAYLATKANGAGIPAGIPAQPEYGTQASVLIVKGEGDAAGLGEAIDGWLSANGFPGCIVNGKGNTVSIAWAWSLHYTEPQIRRAFLGLSASVRV